MSTLPEWELLVSQRDAAQDLARRRGAERDALRSGVQAILDDAWLNVPPDVEAALRELLDDGGVRETEVVG